MIRTIQNFELFYKKPFQMLNILTYRWRHFERGFCKWNNFMMLMYLIQASIFRYSKNDGSLTHETRIKDAVNMGDLICLNDTLELLPKKNHIGVIIARNISLTRVNWGYTLELSPKRSHISVNIARNVFLCSVAWKITYLKLTVKRTYISVANARNIFLSLGRNTSEH